LLAAATASLAEAVTFRMGGLYAKSTAVKAPVLPPAALSRPTVTTETLAEIAVLFALAVWEPAQQAAWGGAGHAAGDSAITTSPMPPPLTSREVEIWLLSDAGGAGAAGGAVALTCSVKSELNHRFAFLGAITAKVSWRHVASFFLVAMAVFGLRLGVSASPRQHRP
jgi:hypothetical protein